MEKPLSIPVCPSEVPAVVPSGEKIAKLFWLSHFLDDYSLLQKTYMALEEFVQAFYNIMADIRMLVAKHKTFGPTQIFKYLRLILNFIL